MDSNVIYAYIICVDLHVGVCMFVSISRICYGYQVMPLTIAIQVSDWSTYIYIFICIFHML